MPPGMYCECGSIFSMGDGLFLDARDGSEYPGQELVSHEETNEDFYEFMVREGIDGRCGKCRKPLEDHPNRECRFRYI